MPVSDEFKRTVGKALGRIPSGVFILTASHNGDATAIMASWCQQAAFDPPTITAAIAKGRPIAPIIQASKKFALSILPENDTTLMKRYARGVKPGDDAFTGVETFTTPAGIPALKSALAWLDCQLMDAIDFGGDHELLIAEVVGGAILHPGQAFMHQRGSGFHY